MSDSLVCWQCGASLAQLSLPIRRQDECRSCRAELHACKLCRFYDVTVAKQCREPVAEAVRDKNRANYCDYFEPRLDAYSNTATQQAAAKTQLEQLFGGTPGSSVQSPAEQAQAELEKLFGKKS